MTSPRLTAALDEARSVGAERGWRAPEPTTIDEAERLLRLLRERRPPVVQVEPDGSITFEWDVGAHGWLELSVDGSGMLMHSAVIEGDDYAQSELFVDRLPDWAETLLHKLLDVGH